MEEKYLITFEQLRESCRHRCKVSDDCWHIENKAICNEQSCPILKTLERPSVQITPVRGK